MLGKARKLELLKFIPAIMTDLIDVHDISSSVTKGPNSIAQEISNRCEQVAKDISTRTSYIQDDYQYLVDTCTILIQKSLKKEISISRNGKILTREQLAFDYGVFLKPKDKMI